LPKLFVGDHQDEQSFRYLSAICLNHSREEHFRYWNTYRETWL